MPADEQLLLHPDRPLRLDAARHAELRVDAGIVWIAGGDAGDVFLSAGGRYRVPRRGRALAEALRGVATISLVPRRRRRLAWLSHLLPEFAG